MLKALQAAILTVLSATSMATIFGCQRDSAEQSQPFQQETQQMFSETADPHADIQKALAVASREHKRVILDFGGNWCGDCMVLNIYFHQPPNAALLSANFVVVDINVGHMDRNLDVAEKYGVPVTRGVPALAVLGPDGSLLYSQRNREGEAMGRSDPAAVTNFLNTWRPES
jgi:thioredoxin 1